MTPPRFRWRRPDPDRRRWTFAEVVAVLKARGPMTAEALGAYLWPSIVGGSSKGGPPNSAVAASWMLGRMRRRGLVRQHIPRRGLSTWSAI